MTLSELIKKPSAFLPILCSLAALGVVIVHLSVYGIRRQADEGTAAHIFQILIAGQVPIIAFFGIKWIPREPRRTILILAVQAVAALAALAPIFLLDF